MAKTLYHVTPSENVEAILKNGLLRVHGDVRSAFICLSEKPDSWMVDGLTLLDADIEGLDEVCVCGDIPPNRIRITKGVQLT